MTHWDSQAETCCAIYCSWMRELLTGRSMAEAWGLALQETQRVAGRDVRPINTPGMRPLPGDFWTRLEAVESKRYTDLQPSGYAGYVVECLEAAAWCCLKSNSLEQALVRVVNLAGEADTMGAVAGGIAGACWGSQAIPPRWLDKLFQRAELERVAGQLAELRAHLELSAH